LFYKYSLVYNAFDKNLRSYDYREVIDYRIVLMP